MKRLLLLFLVITVSACAKVSMNVSCAPSATGVSFGLAGSTIGNTAISMLGGVATKAGVMTTANQPAPTSGSMTYEYIPIFGSDGGSLNCNQPPTQTVVVTSPPAQVIH